MIDDRVTAPEVRMRRRHVPPPPLPFVLRLQPSAPVVGEVGERDRALMVGEDPPYLARGRGALAPLLPADGVRVAVVSTLRDVGGQLLAWAEWYRIIGVAHLFLYFDDPGRDACRLGGQS